MAEPWICPKDNDPGCVGHCPRCDGNKIGGGGCNGMFCVTCGYYWGDEEDEKVAHFLDYFLKQVDAPESGTL